MDARAELLTGPLLLVSPHLDDAALSCAALLARAEPVDVLNIFAGEPVPPQLSPWDRLCGFENSTESGEARRREDARAFAGSQHRVRSLELLDWEYAQHPRSDDDAAEISAAVGRWATAVGGGTVAVPAGAGWRPPRLYARIAGVVDRRFREPGWNPDHIFVRDAVLAHLPQLPILVPLLYEELPYLLGGRADREVAKTALAWRRKAVPIVAAIDRPSKAKRIAAYASQLPHLCENGRRLDHPADLPTAERYWRLDPIDVDRRGPE